MRKILLIGFLFFFILGLKAQDTLLTWNDETIICRIVKIDNRIVSVILPEDTTKIHRVSESELQRAVYSNGQVVYFFEKYPDVVNKMKKASPYRNMIEIGPAGIPFNHFYGGYERNYAKRRSYEIQAGFMLPMLIPEYEKVKGFHLNLAWKSIFTEPVRISGLSVRPKLQGAYCGFMLSLNSVSYTQNIAYPVDTNVFIIYEDRKTRVKALVPTMHFVFGYNQMVAPAVMIGFSAGLGGGPLIVLNSDQYIREKATLPETVIGIQRFISFPFSLSAMLTVGYLFK